MLRHGARTQSKDMSERTEVLQSRPAGNGGPTALRLVNDRAGGGSEEDAEGGAYSGTTRFSPAESSGSSEASVAEYN